MPFTDPGADGPVIQLANQRALKAGANMGQTLRIVRDFRAKNQSTALVLMGYYNPVMAYGSERFIFDAKAAGVDGLIIVDLPPEEDQELRALCKAQGIDLIRLLTPTSDEKRLKTLLEGVSGFLYYVSITGVTGTASANLAQLEPHLDMIRQHTDLPIAIGFGIKTPEDAAQMARIGDAVVVGSALIGLLNGDSGVEQDSSLAALGQFTQKLAAAL
jgi:tryptophan synthase alpha chain